MYTSGSTTNLQMMLNEISESGATAKIRMGVESDAVRH